MLRQPLEIQDFRKWSEVEMGSGKEITQVTAGVVRVNHLLRKSMEKAEI